MTEHEELAREVAEILQNARILRLADIITAEQEEGAVRIPRRDLLISAQENGLDMMDALRYVTEKVRQS
jgi:hypothetical protein